MSSVRLRYAPSPTGYLHIGGARTALFNYLFAKHYNGDFIVRIEDTDLERNIDDGITNQLDNLRWLGIQIDETVDDEGKFGPYKQTERLEIYLKYAEQLITKKFAYYCFCTPEQLEKSRENQINSGVSAPIYLGQCWKLEQKIITDNIMNNVKRTIRLKIPSNKEYIVRDLVRQDVTFNSNDIGDFVIIKSNQVATYNFAVVIDDYLMQITHVLRGEEHLSNTPKQLLIYELFGWKSPEFGHLTLIINTERKKLSKRDGNVVQFISQYRNLGYLPEALFNFFALLGWSPDVEEEIFSKNELIKNFNYKRFSKAPSMFDINKLNWMNGQYIKKLPVEALYRLCKPFLDKAYNLKLYDVHWIKKVISIYQNELLYGEKIIDLTKLFFDSKHQFSQDGSNYIKKNQLQLVIEQFLQKIIKLKKWNENEIKLVINDVKNTTNKSGKLLFMPIRFAISQNEHGPDLIKIIFLLGKEKVIRNINCILNQGCDNCD